MTANARIASIEIDEKSLAPAGPDAEHERKVAIFDMIESNSFEFLRGCLVHEQALTFQMSLGSSAESGDIVAREVIDRGFPSGRLVLASLRGRQLPVIAFAFARFLTETTAEPVAELTDEPTATDAQVAAPHPSPMVP